MQMVMVLQQNYETLDENEKEILAGICSDSVSAEQWQEYDEYKKGLRSEGDNADSNGEESYESNNNDLPHSEFSDEESYATLSIRSRY
jgi:hypothetical protein